MHEERNMPLPHGLTFMARVQLYGYNGYYLTTLHPAEAQRHLDGKHCRIRNVKHGKVQSIEVIESLGAESGRPSRRSRLSGIPIVNSYNLEAPSRRRDFWWTRAVYPDMRKSPQLLRMNDKRDAAQRWAPKAQSGERTVKLEDIG